MVTDQIHAEVQQLQDEEIHFFTESLHKETGHYEEKEISELELLQATKTSQAKLKIKRDLLAQRQAMASELFDSVADELKAFAASSAYADLLEKKLDKHAKIAGKAGTFHRARTGRSADARNLKAQGLFPAGGNSVSGIWRMAFYVSVRGL